MVVGRGVLKADLHLHTSEREPWIAYDAYALVDRAAREGYQVLSITNHDAVTFSERLAAYAWKRGILLIPEFSHFYTRGIDFNRPAVETARTTGLPLVGSSDSHFDRQFGTYSLIESEPTVACVMSAVRKGRVRVVSRPLALGEMAGIGARLALRDVWRATRATLRRREPGPKPLRGLARGR